MIKKNKVTYADQSKNPIVDLSTDSLRNMHLMNGHSAFIGSVPKREEGQHKLFLITYSCVVAAEDFSETWKTCKNWEVDQWVDIEIVVN